MARERELLEKLRSTLIGELHVQPYIIYDDNTIELLLQKRPKTLDELKEVKGFPEKGKRFSTFGKQIVEIFSNPGAIADFKLRSGDVNNPIDIVPKKIEI